MCTNRILQKDDHKKENKNKMEMLLPLKFHQNQNKMKSNQKKCIHSIVPSNILSDWMKNSGIQVLSNELFHNAIAILWMFSFLSISHSSAASDSFTTQRTTNPFNIVSYILFVFRLDMGLVQTGGKI